jgi:hypothetical protein
MKRISIRDKIFTECSDQGNILVDSNKYEAVIVNAAFVSRSYYEGDYDPDKLMLPTCWSSDTQVPSSDVPQEQRQAARCMDCSHNIRGSGYKSSRACRFAQQIAVLPVDRLQEVYQIRLPATSIFGQARGGHMPMKAYAEFLLYRDTPITSVLTEIYFDDNSSTPKLFFKPIRPLRDEEFKVVSEMINHVDTTQAITLDYTPFEGSTKSPFEVSDGFQY